MPIDISNERLIRKANQHYEMAGCARQDGDKVDELKHLQMAKEYDRLLMELYGK